MVSGGPEGFMLKSQRGYNFGASLTPLQLAQQKRYSDGQLRPWPPMYKSNKSNGYRSAASTKTSSSNGSTFNYYLYSGRNAKYNNGTNFQQKPPNKVSTAPPFNLMHQSKEQYFLTPSYLRNSTPQKASPFPSANNKENGLLMIDRDQGVRKLSRTSAQTFPNHRISCACNRSKSMEDIRDVVVDWREPTFGANAQNFLNNGHLLGKGINGLKDKLNGIRPLTIAEQLNNCKNSRRSMDNLLQVDTNFARKFQVNFRENHGD